MTNHHEIFPLMRKKTYQRMMRWLTSLLLIIPACDSPKIDADAHRETFVIASTTSTQDSGILDSLVPAFEKQFPKYSAKVVAVGSGEAMQLGANGDADVLLVHSPPDEEEFMKTGKGLYRRAVMSNSFAVAGPDSDPAMIRDVTSAEEAFKKIAAASSTFMSRGDRSGTHKEELRIWRSISTEPSGSWYLESGQGMGETITIAAEKSAYLLTDTATFKVFGSKTALELLFQGGDSLKNPYSVIPIVGARRAQAAKAFAEWMTGTSGQRLIREFGRKKYGEPLFTPAEL